MLNADELRQTTITVIVTIALTLGIFWGETYRRQSNYFNEGVAFMDSDNFRRAVTSFESALHMYTPFSGKIERSASRLLEIAQRYESQDDIDMALVTYRTLRSAFYATRSFYTPYPEIIAVCDTKIAELIEIQRERNIVGDIETTIDATAQ